MNQCTWILEKHNFFIFEEINSIILILAVLPFCTLTADLIALSSHIRKKRNNCLWSCLLCPLGFTDLSHILTPAVSFPGRRYLPYWITPFRAAFQTLCHPHLLFWMPFNSASALLRCEEAGQGRTALWTQSHMMRLFFFRSVPLDVLLLLGLLPWLLLNY